MEDNDIQEAIDNRYIIINKIGYGLTANVYLVKDNINQTLYAAKVLKKPSEYFQNEINILNELRGINNSHLVNLITSGEGKISRGNKEKRRQYIILENASKGELMNYILYAQSGLGERLSKLIFFRILDGVQACHNAGICHRDLKMENILLDENFSPKICDFGFAVRNTDQLDDVKGTEHFCAPEILEGKKYNGFTADIFSLGATLMSLTTGNYGFINAVQKDKYYKLIMQNQIDSYWKKIEKNLPPISQEFKELYIKMVSYIPKDRPTIKEIIDSNWMKEIKNLTKEQLEKLENEAKEEFIKRQPLVDAGLKAEVEVEMESSDESGGNRGDNDDDNYFEQDLNVNYVESELSMYNYITLKGKLTPYKYMSDLINKIKKEFSNYKIEIIDKKKAKFNVIFNEEEIEEEELEEEELEEEADEEKFQNIKGKKTIIQVKLYQNYNEEHLLRFVKKEGELKNYLEKLKKIYGLIIKK